ARRALARAAEVDGALRGAQAVVSPVQVGGTVYYRVLVDPAASQSEVEALRGSAAAVLGVRDPSGWIPRRTPMGFLVDRFESLADAQARAATLRERGIWAYVREVEGGGPAFAVYVGAYEGTSDAATLARQLRSAGLGDARFVRRVGRVPAEPPRNR
ncbi:MAG: SPOR domain-containing protein, partial [Gemmatimonadetes bacterium]